MPPYKMPMQAGAMQFARHRLQTEHPPWTRDPEEMMNLVTRSFSVSGSVVFRRLRCKQGQLPRALSRMRWTKLGTCTTARPTVPLPISSVPSWARTRMI